MLKTTIDAKNSLTIDFPHAGEVVTSPYYAFRIDAPNATRVAVSIDGGPWNPCRHAIGYWWYDWSGYGPGPHQVRVQTENADGAVTAVESRRVAVRLDEAAAERRKS